MRYIGVDGIATQKHSKKYTSKKEAEATEFYFKRKLHNNEKMSCITFEEMMNFTYEQFKQFLSVEDNLKFRVTFEILYYCGLR